MKLVLARALIDIFHAQQGTSAQAVAAMVEITKMFPPTPERQPIIDALQNAVDALTDQGSKLQAVVAALQHEMGESDGAS